MGGTAGAHVEKWQVRKDDDGCWYVVAPYNAETIPVPSHAAGIEKMKDMQIEKFCQENPGEALAAAILLYAALQQNTTE